MHGQGPKAPQFKFNKLFNEHFPSPNFFQKSFVRKNWRGGDELFLNNSTIDGYAF